MKTNLTWSLLPLIATIVSLCHIGQASAATVAAWNFENNPIAVNNNPAASAGTGTASSIGMDVYPTPNIGVTTDDVLLGVAGDTGANTVANLTQVWRVRAAAGAPVVQPTGGQAPRRSARRGPYSPRAPSASMPRSTSASIGTIPRRARPISNCNTPRTAAPLGPTCRSPWAGPTAVWSL